MTLVSTNEYLLYPRIVCKHSDITNTKIARDSFPVEQQPPAPVFFTETFERVSFYLSIRGEVTEVEAASWVTTEWPTITIAAVLIISHKD